MQAQELIDLARAMTLDALGETERAVAIIEQKLRSTPLVGTALITCPNDRMGSSPSGVRPCATVSATVWGCRAGGNPPRAGLARFRASRRPC
jgi:hypothetical protein